MTGKRGEGGGGGKLTTVKLGYTIRVCKTKHQLSITHYDLFIIIHYFIYLFIFFFFWGGGGGLQNMLYLYQGNTFDVPVSGPRVSHTLS